MSSGALTFKGISPRHADHSSAWIAHGILDSIVDSFFPILNHVELEARTMVFAEGVEEPNSTTSDLSGSTLVPSTETLSDKPASVQDADKLPTFHEKQSFVKRNLAVAKYQPRFVAPAWTPARVYRRTRRLFRLAVIWVRTRRPTYTKQPPPNPTATNLRRMARARRLVTLLGRVLAAKSEVVARLRKRLLSSTERGALDQDEIEVAMYLGDVQGMLHRTWARVETHVWPRSYIVTAAFSSSLRARSQSVASDLPATTPNHRVARPW